MKDEPIQGCDIKPIFKLVWYKVSKIRLEGNNELIIKCPWYTLDEDSHSINKDSFLDGVSNNLIITCTTDVIT